MESLDALLADLQSAASPRLTLQQWQTPAPPREQGTGADSQSSTRSLGTNEGEVHGNSLSPKGCEYEDNSTFEGDKRDMECNGWKPSKAPVNAAVDITADSAGAFPARMMQQHPDMNMPAGSTNSYEEEEPMYEPQNIRDNRVPAVALDIHAQSAPGTQGRVTSAPPSKSTMSSLAHNLSELDMLLRDLNSSMQLPHPDGAGDIGQAAGDSSMSGIRLPPPNVPPKPRATFAPDLASAMSSAQKQSATMPIYSQVQRKDGSVGNQGTSVPVPVPASSATRELDELMSSLSQFKINTSSGEPAQLTKPLPPMASTGQIQAIGAADRAAANPLQLMATKLPQATAQGGREPDSSLAVVASGGRHDLESLLGHLETDLTRQGASVAVRGKCAACSKPIAGQVITALGQVWHPEHFCCRSCGCELGTVSFFERDGVPYCEDDYHELFAPKCAACNGPIVDKCVTAMDVTWHTECFACAACGRELSNEGFHEKDGRPFCRDDYFAMFAPKCGGCGTPIVENYISALSRHWHPQCFVCMECGAGFAGGSFFDYEGLPYCETHYHARKGSLCAGCQKPVAGRCIAAMGKKFHPEHFVCAFCLKQLNKGTFKEQNDKPYCHSCFVKLFG